MSEIITGEKIPRISRVEPSELDVCNLPTVFQKCGHATKGVKLADTIEEGEALGQNHKWYSFSSKMPVVSKPISMQDMSADSGIRT